MIDVREDGTSPIRLGCFRPLSIVRTYGLALLLRRSPGVGVP